MIAILAPTRLEAGLLLPLLPERQDLPGGFRACRGTFADRELLLVTCGVGKTNAAAATSALLTSYAVERVVLIGCGGAYPGSGLRIGDLAVATAEIHGDEGCITPDGFLDMEALKLPTCIAADQNRLYNRFPVSPGQLELCRSPLQSLVERLACRIAFGPFVTVSTCSGRLDVGTGLVTRTAGICENMEGGAVAQVCTRFGTGFFELRGISNLVEDRDMSRWDLAGGAAIAQQGILTLLETVWQGDVA